MAPWGHSPTQAPRPSHVISETSRAFPSIIWSAPSGQPWAQSPQPSHFSSSIRMIWRSMVSSWQPQAWDAGGRGTLMAVKPGKKVSQRSLQDDLLEADRPDPLIGQQDVVVVESPARNAGQVEDGPVQELEPR